VYDNDLMHVVDDHMLTRCAVLIGIMVQRSRTGGDLGSEMADRWIRWELAWVSDRIAPGALIFASLLDLSIRWRRVMKRATGKIDEPPVA
jgi:hypothetical protein